MRQVAVPPTRPEAMMTGARVVTADAESRFSRIMSKMPELWSEARKDLKASSSKLCRMDSSFSRHSRKFRDIARISGLIFTGFPGKQKKERHLQASSQLIFEVFREYEPDNLLYLQTYDEVMTFQLEESRMRKSLNKITDSHILISRPTKATPFSFPIIVDRLREKLTSEKLEDRIRKMTAELIK